MYVIFVSIKFMYTYDNGTFHNLAIASVNSVVQKLLVEFSGE